jgi:hypothetical protein
MSPQKTVQMDGDAVLPQQRANCTCDESNDTNDREIWSEVILEVPQIQKKSFFPLFCWIRGILTIFN